jgi:hypothetical protein
VTVVIVLVVLAVPLVILALGGGGDEPAQRRAPELRVERSGSAAGLTVYVAARANVPARAHGARTVVLECVDGAGRLVHAHEEAWPLAGADPLAGGPHAHVPLDPAGMNEVARCRM